MENIFLSLIIPVYRVEEYLHECVDSVLSQNIKDMEIILVDDGSPDNCPAICDEYAKKENIIKVIHKENGGLSSARNCGLKIACGEYVMFMDSDDYWNKNVCVTSMIEIVKLYPSIEMFLFSSIDFQEEKGYFRRIEHEKLSFIDTTSKVSYYSGLLNNGNLEVSACTKILKRKFLIDNNLYFKEKILSEDNEWMLRLLRDLRTVKIINEPLYICRIARTGSITNTIGKKNISDLLIIIESSINFYKNNDSEVKNLEFCYLSYLWFSALGLSAFLEKKDREELSERFKNTSFICKYSNNKKTKLSNLVYKIFGLRIACLILYRYIKLKQKMNINKKEYNG